jgi:hypothetical protein
MGSTSNHRSGCGRFMSGSLGRCGA